MKMIKLASTILLFSCTFLTPAFTQVSMKPSLADLKVSKNGSTEFELTISNSSEYKETCKMTIHNMDISEDGRPFISDSSSERSCRDWARFDVQEFTVEPMSSKKVRVKIKVPADTVGTFSAMYKCSFNANMIPFQNSGNNKSNNTIELGRSYAGVLLVTVRSFDNQVKIIPKNLQIHPGRRTASEESAGQPEVWRIRSRIQNAGNTYTIAKGNVRIFSSAGMLVESSALTSGRGYVLPGKQRLFEASGSKPLPDGLYVLKSTINIDRGKAHEHMTPFGVYKGKLVLNVESEDIREIIKAVSPGFQLRRQFKDLSITANGKTFGSVLLRNLTNDTLNVVPRVSNWWVDENGGIVISNDAAIKDRSCFTWITDLKSDFQILPKSSFSYRFKLEAPEQLDGEYFSAIVFDRDQLKDNYNTDLVAGRSCFLSVQDKRSLRDTVCIKDIKIVKKDRLVHLKFKIENTGNCRVDFSGNIHLAVETAPEFFEVFGEPVRYGREGLWIMPGSSRTADIELPNLVEDGRYEVTVNVGLPGAERRFSEYRRLYVN